MAPTSDNGSRDAGETRTMQEGSMKFVVAAVGSDSEETAALLELLAGERLGFDRPQGEVDEDRPALLRHAPDSPRGYLSCVLASDANLEPALEALREARVVLWLHRARVFDVELLVRFRRLREARDALADAALDPPVLVVVGVAPRSNAHGDPSERDGTDDEVRELLRPHASVPGDGVAAADDTPLFRLPRRRRASRTLLRNRRARCSRVRRRLRRRRVQNRCNAIDRRAEKDRRCR